MLKTFPVYFSDLTTGAQERLCKSFHTEDSQENWTGCGAQPLTEIHREVKDEVVKMRVTYELQVVLHEDDLQPRHVMDHFIIDPHIMQNTKMTLVKTDLIEFSDDWE